MKRSKKWCIGFIVAVLFITMLVGGLTAYVDPYFHYHKPLEQLSYQLQDQRYQNDGIVKNFTYNAIITGTSMTENFLVSEMNTLFDVDAIKVPFSGGSYKEINDIISTALKNNPEIKTVLRSLDGFRMWEDKDTMAEMDYPEYLYDDNLINDVEYLLNKTVFFADVLDVLVFTPRGRETTSFDDYSYWGDMFSFGIETLKEQNPWLDTSKDVPYPDAVFPQNYELNVRGNVVQNALALALEYPEVQFYYFFPPYYIGYWDMLRSTNSIPIQIEGYRIASEILLEQENIHLFSFCSDYDIITNSNHYKDCLHYSPEINSKILQDIRSGRFALSKENYEEYWRNVENFYLSFDYDTYFSAEMGF